MELGGNSVAAVAASVALQTEQFPVTVTQLLSDNTLKHIILQLNCSRSFLELGGNSVAAVAASVALQREQFPVRVSKLLSDNTLKHIIRIGP